MNKLISFIFFSFFWFFVSVEAQPITKQSRAYGNTLNMGLGIGGYGGAYGYMGSNLPVLHIDYELQVTPDITLAPFISFSTSNRKYYWGDPSHPKAFYNYRQTVVPIGLKGTYYLDKILKASSKWDFYLAGSLGFAIVSAKWDEAYIGDRNYYRTPNPLFLNIHAGIEYHINSKIGAYLDFSTGVSTFGLAFH